MTNRHPTQNLVRRGYAAVRAFPNGKHGVTRKTQASPRETRALTVFGQGETRKAMAAGQKHAEEQLARANRDIRRAFLTYVANASSAAVTRAVKPLLLQGRIEDALNLLDTHVTRFASTVTRVFMTVGDEEVDYLTPDRRLQKAEWPTNIADLIGGTGALWSGPPNTRPWLAYNQGIPLRGKTGLLRRFATSEAAEDALKELGIDVPDLKRPRPTLAQGTPVGYSFDAGSPRATEIMRRARLSLIRQFSRTQREATRTALVTMLREGKGPAEIARTFRESIGLTSTQLAAVNNYRRLLEEGSAEALQRDLRDRRFDRTVRDTFTNGEPLAQGQISNMVERYRERYLQYRAEAIARTESLRVVNEAKHEAMQQVAEQAGIEESGITRVWHSTRDARTRDTHRAMDGQVRGLNEPFVSPSGARLMYPGDSEGGASESINCRCVVTNRIA